MKKLNGILIFIAALSVALLAFVMFAAGILPIKTSKAEPTVAPRKQYNDNYDVASGDVKELASAYVYVRFSNYVNPDDIYTEEFQKTVRYGINSLKKEKGPHTEDNPLLIINPFCTNSQSLYVYFKTIEPCAVSYSIHPIIENNGYTDFGGNALPVYETHTEADGTKTYGPNSLVHEFSVTGLVPGVVNAITFTLTDKDGNKSYRRVNYTPAEYENSGEKNLIVKAGMKSVYDEETETTKLVNESDETLSDGWFAVFAKENEVSAYARIYDNDGCIRMKIPLADATPDKIVIRNNEIYMPVSSNKFVRINALGEVVGIYESDAFEYGPDWFVDENGNIVTIASMKNRQGINDCVALIDIKTGVTNSLVDFAVLLKEYLGPVGNYDWLNLTSISYMGENMIMVAGDKPNIFIKVRRLYNDPRIEYIAGDVSKFKDTILESIVLKPEGDFTFTTSVTDAGTLDYDKIRESRDYIYVLDRNSDYKYEKKEAKFGFFTKYLVDSDEKSLRVSGTDRIEHEITEYADIFRYDGKWLVVYGNESILYEYDNDFNLIASFTYKAPVIKKSVADRDREEDNPPPDDTIIYKGICKFDPNEYLFEKTPTVYVYGVPTEAETN